ncbi:DUF1236 domain-containing protein [Leptospira interrogans]
MRLKTLTQVAAAALLASASSAAYAQMGGQQQQPSGGGSPQPGMQMPKGEPGGSARQPGAGGGAKTDSERGQRNLTPERGASEQKSRNRQQERVGEQQGQKKEQRAGERQDGMKKEQRAGEQRGKERQQQARERPGGEAGKGAGGGVGARPDISSQQRTTIRQRLSSGPRVNEVNFAVAVGTRIPRSVSLRVLPASVIEIVPQYRGYRYVLVGNRILIVDPETFEIVYVIS